MPNISKRPLQVIIAVGTLIPIIVGGSGMLMGPAMLPNILSGTISLDSHYRYLSGLLFAIGLGFLSTVPKIETHGPRIRLLTLLVFVGGLGRLISLISVGVPDNYMLGGLLMELVITPAIAFWQFKVSQRA